MNQIRVTTAQWDLNARGNGTVTYHRIGQGDGCWLSEYPGALEIRREKGGTFRASERKASSLVELPYTASLDERVVEITVSYRGGQKTGTQRRITTLRDVVSEESIARLEVASALVAWGAALGML